MKSYEIQTSTYIIEDDKLIITTTEVGNAEAKYESDELEYEFKSTWTRR